MDISLTLFFDSNRTIVNVVIGLFGAQNSSIVVCVYSTRFSAAEKKSVQYGIERWSSVCFVQQQQQREKKNISD